MYHSITIDIIIQTDKTKQIMLLTCIQDKEDNLKVGVKFMALRFGGSTKQWIIGFGIACIGSLSLNGFNAGIGKYSVPYVNLFSGRRKKKRGAGRSYYAFLAAASGHLAWQIWTVDLSSRADCNRKCAILFCCILFFGV
jgi:4-hydroxybenzoate polyprenyltransferase